MNRLRGRIIAIESSGHLSLVDVAVRGDIFTALLAEAPAGAPYLTVGNAVLVLFKETEVSLAKDLSGQISLRNRIKCAVKHIRHGQILSEVTLDYQGQEIVSVITSRSIMRLDLREGDEAEALIKANEVSLTELNDES